MTEYKREEILSKAKPIRFNMDMVRAILDGRKTQIRLVLKPYKHIPKDAVFGYTAFTPEGHISARGVWVDEECEERYGEKFFKLPYHPGDILYVRETWGIYEQSYMDALYVLYRADFPNGAKTFDADGVSCDLPKWRPSIHMPKKEARIFLRVTNVRVERLQDITPEQVDAEGCKEYAYSTKTGELLPSKPTWFEIIWDNTIKKSDLNRYGWEANPWVWVIEFERLEDTGNEQK